MPRKCMAKVVLSKQQREILDELAARLGTSESETLHMALMDYAKELSLVTEKVHRTGARRSLQDEKPQKHWQRTGFGLLTHRE